jgi:hypothetical protein
MLPDESPASPRPPVAANLTRVLDQNDIVAHATGEKMATISQVNAGIIRKDLAKIGEARAALKKFTVAELIEISAKAGEHFLNGELPFGDKGHTQTADDYVRTLSSTSGLPHVMVRRNMAKIHHALTNMRTVLNGLTRGLPLEVIDRGYGEQSGAAVSYFPTTQALGLVMPSNSPAVNSLWLPAIALKTPVIIKPGSRGALDSLPAYPSVHRRRRASGSVRFLSHRPRRRRRGDENLWSRTDLRRRRDGCPVSR